MLSEKQVTFHALATFCRDQLRCTDALYLAGVIPQFYAPPQKPAVGTGTRFAGPVSVTAK